jgi:hypothetical protein
MGVKLGLTLREEGGLRVLENRVLRRIFRPKRDAVAEGCRKLHNEELHGLYSSPSTGVSKRTLQLYSKNYCVARVTKTPLSLSVSVTLATQQHLECHCKAYFFKQPACSIVP